MEKIILKFAVTPSIFPGNRVVVIMTLDEKDKGYKARMEDTLFGNQKEMSPMPKRVMNAFTVNVINKILSMDEIPNKSGIVVLDGNSYEITITKGSVRKEFYADEASIETYPLLRYLASWCRRQ